MDTLWRPEERPRTVPFQAKLAGRRDKQHHGLRPGKVEDKAENPFMAQGMFGVGDVVGVWRK